MKEETEIDEIPENFSPVEMIEAIKRHRVEFVSPARCCTRCPVTRTAGVSAGQQQLRPGSWLPPWPSLMRPSLCP